MKYDQKIESKVIEYLELDDVTRQSVQYKLYYRYHSITHEIFGNGCINWEAEKYELNLNGYPFEYLADFVKNHSVFEKESKESIDEFMTAFDLCKNAVDLSFLVNEFELDDYENSIWKTLDFSKSKTTQEELDSAPIWDEELNWLIEWLSKHPLKSWNPAFLNKLKSSFETLRCKVPIGVIDYGSEKEWYQQNNETETSGDGDIDFANEVLFDWIQENPDLIDLNGKSLGKSVKKIYSSKGSSFDDSWIVNLKQWGYENSIVDKKSVFTNAYLLPKNSKDIINLTELDLSDYKLDKLPKELFNLVNLTKLDLSKNNLKEIPKEIGKLKNLTSLSLMKNSIKEIPSEIGDLVNLKSLNLYSNQLTALPKEIGNLVNLTKLILRFNKISEMPEDVKKLKKLTFLDTDSFL